ncbi:MAG: hypothetical protein OXC06_15205, partial [Acidimicrobiaceae bacterium]|nr:hypothetical protein [Acidimicrobiaceae bacterium]
RGTTALSPTLPARHARVGVVSPGWHPFFPSQQGTRLDSPAHNAVSVPAETSVVLASEPHQH